MPKTDLADLIACPECDTLHRRQALAQRSVARCQRCNAVMYQSTPQRLDVILAISVTALIVFGIANAFPIVELQLQGTTVSTTLFGAVTQLWSEDRYWLSVLVFAAAIMFPFTEIACLIYLLGPLSWQRLPPGFDGMLRAVQAVRPWGMIEVLMLGILITMVKLSSYARLLPEPAIFAYAVLTALVALLAMFDPGSLWEYAERERERRRLIEPAGPSANARRIASDGVARSYQVPQ